MSLSRSLTTLIRARDKWNIEPGVNNTEKYRRHYRNPTTTMAVMLRRFWRGGYSFLRDFLCARKEEYDKSELLYDSLPLGAARRLKRDRCICGSANSNKRTRKIENSKILCVYRMIMWSKLIEFMTNENENRTVDLKNWKRKHIVFYIVCYSFVSVIFFFRPPDIICSRRNRFIKPSDTIRTSCGFLCNNVHTFWCHRVTQNWLGKKIIDDLEPSRIKTFLVTSEIVVE